MDIDWTDHLNPTLTSFEVSFRDSEGNPLGQFNLADVTHFDGSHRFSDVFNTIGSGQFWGDRFSPTGGIDSTDNSQFPPTKR